MFDRKVMVVLCQVLITSGVMAQATPDINKTMFSFVAPITQHQTDVQQCVVLPAEVVAKTHGVLADVRLISEHGDEIPYLIDTLHQEATDTNQTVKHALRITTTKREQTRATDGTSQFQEMFEVTPEHPSPGAGPLTLLVQTNALGFSRDITVELLEPQPDAKAATATVKGSLFRTQDRSAELMQIALPWPAATRLRITISGQGEGFLEPSFELMFTTPSQQPQTLRVPLTVHLPEERKDGISRYKVERPFGAMPSHLVIQTGTAAFYRHVLVKTSDVAGEPGAAVGRGTVFRQLGAEPNPEMLRVPLTGATSNTFWVEIDDQDSPPLVGLSVAGETTQPILRFAPGYDNVALYFGGGHVRAPHYDVQDLTPESMVVQKIDGTTEGCALTTLASASANKAYAPKALLAFAMKPGALVDTRTYRFERPVTITPTAFGLSIVTLGSDDVALLREDLADVRWVDRTNHQIPFVMDHTLVPVPLTTKASTQDGTTGYALGLPHPEQWVAQVKLATKEPYFDREFHLIGVTPQGEVNLAEGRLTRSPTVDANLTLTFEPTRLTSLILKVRDGDNAPLAWSEVKAEVRMPVLQAVVAEGTYRLLLVNPNAKLPEYELASLDALWRSINGTEAGQGPRRANPDYRKASDIASGFNAGQLALWGVLLMAIVLLLWLTFRATAATRDKV